MCARYAKIGDTLAVVTFASISCVCVQIMRNTHRCAGVLRNSAHHRVSSADQHTFFGGCRRCCRMCASNKFVFKFGVYADPAAMTLHVPYISVGVDVMQMGWHTRMILILINSTVSVWVYPGGRWCGEFWSGTPRKKTCKIIINANLSNIPAKSAAVTAFGGGMVSNDTFCWAHVRVSECVCQLGYEYAWICVTSALCLHISRHRRTGSIDGPAKWLMYSVWECDRQANKASHWINTVSAIIVVII